MADDSVTFAPGWPGIPARWTSSAKSGVGTAVSRDSRVWFTLSHGILNEIYYPRVDHACTRDLGFIVTDGAHVLLGRKARRPLRDVASWPPGVPAYRLRNTAVDGRYRIEKEVLTDPWRDVVLQRVRFVPLQGTLADFRLYVLLAPHLANRGGGNTAWVGDYKGTPMLFAEREQLRAGAGVLGAVARPIGRVRRLLGRMAGTARAQTALPRPTRAPRTATSRSPAKSISQRRTARSCSRSASVPRRWKPASTRSSACSRISTRTEAEYVRGWKAWHATLEGDVPSRGANARSITSARPCCARTNRSVSRRHHRQPVDPVGLLQRRRRPGRLSPGLAARSRRDGGRLPRGRRARATPGGCCGTCRSRRKPTATGRRTCGSTARRTGTAFRWTKPPCPILLVDLAAREGVLDTARARRAAGRWCGERPRFSCAMVRSARRIAGRRSLAIRRSPSRPKSPRCWSPPIWPTRPANTTSPRTYLRETADAWNASIERWLYVAGNRTGAAARRRRLLRARRRAGSSRRRVAVPRVRADQEPAAGSSRRGRRR